jgi:hypothetical protein
VKQTLALALALVAGCSFNPGKDTDLGGGGDDMGGGAGDDLSTGADMTMICTPSQKTCTGGMLATCNLDGTAIDSVACLLGCNAAGTDCASLQPTAPAVASDFVYGGLSELTIAASQTLLVFDTDTGEIRDGAGAVVRMPNAAPTSRFVEDGIGFHRVSGTGIWTFSKLTVPAMTTIVFKSPYAASILSASDLTIAGTIDARGYATPTMMSTLCMGTVAGPGGAPGGVAAAAGTGAGGSPTDTSTGAGGGGYGDTGGNGGKHGGTTGATGGPVAGTTAINPLLGGFGGGTSGGMGGGGGGALQLAAEGALTISGGINAGGCGGGPGDGTHGGGGGGSGGAILVEAPTIHLTAAAKLAANGGGGGGGGDLTAGQGGPGLLGSQQATAGSAGNGGNGTAGGLGGALNNTTGGNGSNGSTAGGGGGGGIGRMRFNSRAAGATVDGGSIVSPAQTAGVVVIQ